MNESFPGSEPRLVAIVGPSGAGKSRLAHELQTRLGKDAARLCLDDFYRDRSHLTQGQRAGVNFDRPQSIDWAFFERVLARCRAGRPLQVPRYDFASHARLAKLEWWRPKPLVLVEGLWLLRRRAVRRLISFSVFMECACPLQLRRRLRRDALERGRSAGSVREQFWGRVVPMGERYVLPQARWADVVLTSPVSAKAIDRLAEQLRGLLGSPPAARP